MPGVFISYERGAEATARRVAAQLRAEGREVWLDVDLPPHRAYADVIREHLESADAVLVLWSADAAESAWVRAEADVGRQRDKLVQARLDSGVLPLPFNQIQCADLRGWRGGASAPEWRKIAAAIDELTAKAPAPVPQPPEAVSHVRAVAPRRRWLGPGLAAVGALVVVAVGGWLMRDQLPWTARPLGTRVAVLPFRTASQTAGATDFATGVVDQLRSTLSQTQLQVVSHEDAETLAGPDRDDKARQLGVRLFLSGSVASDSKTLDVTVDLEDAASHMALWSETLSGPADSPGTLEAHAADRVVSVLNCARYALRPVGGLADPQTLGLFLKACGIEEGQTGHDNYDGAMTALRQVTALAPDFAPARSNIAVSTAIYAALAAPDRQAALRQVAASEAARALALDPNDAEAYVAQSMLLSAEDWAGREALLDKAVAAEPDAADPNGFLAKLLCEVGRLQECRLSMSKAVAEDPFAMDWIGDDLLVEAGGGDVLASDNDADKIMKTWGSDAYTWQQRFNAYAQEARWDRALALLGDPVVAQTMPPVLIDATRTWFAAMKTPTPALVAKARAFAVAAAPMPGADLPNVVSSLSGLGAVDDAFAAATRFQPRPIFADGQFLFFQLTAPMRRDPRFLTLAARLGLLDYWRKSGHWPDYCRDPTLPYKCQ